MTLEEFKAELLAYIDSKSSEDPDEDDIRILETVTDYSAEPSGASEEEIQNRIDEAVGENDKKWIRKYRDRFYSNDSEAEPEEVTEPEVVTNEPEQEELKSVLDYEW